MLGLVGDNLAIVLFFAGLSVTFVVAAISQAGWRHRALVTCMFLLATVFALTSILWTFLKDTFPNSAKFISVVATSPIAWFSIIMFGLGALLFVNWTNRTKAVTAEPIKIKTGITLNYQVGSDNPIVKRAQNVWRCYSLKNIVVIMDKEGVRTEMASTNLFLVFDRSVAMRQIIVKADNIRYEIKDFGPRHAVIAFTESQMDGKVEVSVLI